MSRLFTRIGMAWLAQAVLCSAALAADLAIQGDFASLAGDRRASRVGDIITLVVVENSSASNSAGLSAEQSYAAGGSVSSLNVPRIYGGELKLRDESDGRGTLQRSGRLAAQLSVRVVEVLPSGELLVRGAQEINLNGEKTRISVEGLLRPNDITAGNVALSTRLANARIEYDGDGYVSDSARPGLIARIVNWFRRL
jgi:flagellar L-ring protein precursor FlgH